MSPELYRRARRAEAKADRADDRRRLRLDFFRAALAEGLDSVKVMHAGGASGQESVQAHARVVDDLVKSLTKLITSDTNGLAATPFVVIALGGYGRGELHPSSDIDLMVIYDAELSPYVQRVTQELLYTLWDLGLQIGHSLRSLPDCVAIARTDLASRTSMQAARFLAGDRRLFARFRRVLEENVYQRDFEQFLAATLAERDQRYRKYGASPYIGEPNIKESAGGLRDMHTAMWLAAAKFGTRTLRELNDKGLITPREQAHTDAALTFLWRVRNELHFLAGHKNDVLGRDVQPAIARNFGYEGDERSLDVERFMREYYLHARAIHRVSRRLIARCQETVTVRGVAERRNRHQALADGLVFIDGRLYLADRDSAVFAANPTRLMKVFWHLHRLGCELSVELERAVEESLAPGQSAESEGAAQVFSEVEKPELLMLGMLLHDIGKAKGHGHVKKGIPLIQALCARLDLPAAAAAVVEFLVAHHLTMSHVAQRRDIDDPKTIADFAAAVGDPQRLRMLYLPTWPDMRAVGPGVLTPWQAVILHELYARTMARVTGGRLERPNRAVLADRVAPLVKPDVSVQAVKGHLAMMSERYLATTSAQRIAEHLRLLQRLEEAPVATELFHHPDLGSSDLVVVTRDLPGLFSLIAGTLAAHGINIISAQISTRGDGIAIDTFQVNDPTGETITSPVHWRRTLAALRSVLTGEESVDALLERRRAAGRLPTVVPESPRISIDNTLSDAFTVVEVRCPDRLGLLYLITRTLSACGLDIGSARIATEIDQAYDTFYVHDGQGRRVEDPDALERLRQTLEQALVQPL